MRVQRPSLPESGRTDVLCQCGATLFAKFIDMGRETEEEEKNWSKEVGVYNCARLYVDRKPRLVPRGLPGVRGDNSIA